MKRDAAVLVELRAMRKGFVRLREKVERYEMTTDSFVTMVRDLLSMESQRTMHAKQREQENYLGTTKDDRWARWKREPERGGVVGRSIRPYQRQDGWKDSPAAQNWTGCQQCGDDPCSCKTAAVCGRLLP